MKNNDAFCIRVEKIQWNVFIAESSNWNSSVEKELYDRVMALVVKDFQQVIIIKLLLKILKC